MAVHRPVNVGHPSDTPGTSCCTACRMFVKIVATIAIGCTMRFLKRKRAKVCVREWKHCVPVCACCPVSAVSCASVCMKGMYVNQQCDKFLCCVCSLWLHPVTSVLLPACKVCISSMNSLLYVALLLRKSAVQSNMRIPSTEISNNAMRLNMYAAVTDTTHTSRSRHPFLRPPPRQSHYPCTSRTRSCRRCKGMPMLLARPARHWRRCALTGQSRAARPASQAPRQWPRQRRVWRAPRQS